MSAHDTVTCRPIGIVHSRFTEVSGMPIQTPVLDIKPHVPRFDVRSTERVGWFGPRVARLPDVRADDRME
ncbi:hypothetical protein [Variovorax sp. PBL-E5]|uniref:hypothetical protein n=1 Tax=Variovorax sp. PBL-E5 TaxID=434014 RepID=UPI001316ADD0|nr:hypothetical protein [Variovorax sp. PBL-E5]VTU16659.1 hypothetical protein E5CHR_00188 [Variovorax sp. PBL-E5]